MKNLTAALSVGGVILATQSALGQTYGGPPTQANDLVFGFQNQAGGGTEDYVINLGAGSSIVGKSTVVDLSSDFSLSDFDAVLGSSSSMFGGAVGAANTGTSGKANTADVYLTELRSGAGVPSVAGSSQPAGLSRNADNTTYSQLGTLFCPAAGTGGLDTGKTWESLVDPANGTGTFESNTGVNPDSTVNPSSVLYEDLWYTSSSSLTGTQPFIYEGYFTLDLTGTSPKLTFTGINVPAPLSSPTILSVTKVGITVTVVSGNALASHTYQLQYTTSLNPAAWANVTGSSVVASGTQVTNTDSTATGAQRFYRIQAQ
ncbi:MAG TPA: hypothetical protein VGY56_22240 [Verrucomicrobiae bacterium]|nr:hypothetical protein [Verrucomicrobiae bacterium]